MSLPEVSFSLSKHRRFLLVSQETCWKQQDSRTDKVSESSEGRYNRIKSSCLNTDLNSKELTINRYISKTQISEIIRPTVVHKVVYKVSELVPLWEPSVPQTTDPERGPGSAQMPREDLIKCLKFRAASSGPYICFPLKEIRLMEAWTFLRGLQAFNYSFSGNYLFSGRNNILLWISLHESGTGEEVWSPEGTPQNRRDQRLSHSATLGSRVWTGRRTDFTQTSGRRCLSPANESGFPHLSWSPDSPPCVRREGGGGGRQRQTKKQRKTTKEKEKIKEILFWVKIRTFKFSAFTLGGGLISPLFISEQWMRWQAD